ncbi:MAG: lysophospholipid acyltransferase family protein [Jiangellales bacterium]
MSPADVVPIGTRGKPGRGSGKARTPSSASRSLAGGAAALRPVEDVTDEPTAQPVGPKPPVTKPVATKPTPTKPVAKKPVPKKPVPKKRVSTATEKPAASTSDGPDPDAGGAATGTDDFELPGSLAELLALAGDAAYAVFGSDADKAVAEVLGFARRRLTGDYGVDSFGLDTDLTETLILPLLRPLYEKWFRIEVKGAENIPTEGGALIVANHSGTIAVDAVMTALAVHDETPNNRILRMLGADFVFSLPFVGEMSRKTGSTLACGEDGHRLLTSGELVGVWPEGFKGIGKPYKERYRLQRFGRGGFVSSAIAAGVPIIPTAIVGAEEIYPIIGEIPLLARLLGSPYFPITPTFPWLGPLGMVPLPSKWIIEFGEPIPTNDLAHDEADDPMVVFNLGDQVRETIQHNLYQLLQERRSVFF